MGQRFWGVVVIVAGLFVAAWIYMDLQKRHWEQTDREIKAIITRTDSLARPGPKDTPVQRERERTRNLADQMRLLAGEQTQRTDTVKKVISEEHLLDSEPSTAK